MMGTQAALVLVMATAFVLVSLVVIKFIVRKKIELSAGPEVAMRRNEAGRLMVFGIVSALIMAAVIFGAPQALAPEMMAAAY